MEISPIQFILQEKRTLSNAFTVTELCVTGSMRTTPSLSMRAGTRIVISSKVSKVTLLTAWLLYLASTKELQVEHKVQRDKLYNLLCRK